MTEATNDGTTDYRYGAPARDGDVATYRTCEDPDCPDIRPGTGHAHLEMVKREAQS